LWGCGVMDMEVGEVRHVFVVVISSKTVMYSHVLNGLSSYTCVYLRI